MPDLLPPGMPVDTVVPEKVQPARHCPVCGGASNRRLYRTRFVLPDEHPLVDGYWVVVCLRCGFVFADTCSVRSDYERYYAEDSRYEEPSISSGSGISSWDAARF